ncbi:diguanylate cyclase domain-containing protein [Actinospongicola halichondriae]|uniref:diguanylate cyclase domain-containing protein n=1 Tax=Actinospongicola halichondriae TaxID=3236844 RepID=UPI003D4E0FBE
MLIVIVVGFGVVSFASTQYQRTVFDRTTSDLRQRTAAVDELERALVRLNQRVMSPLYGATPEVRAAGMSEYLVVRDEIISALGVAEQEFADTAMMPQLRQTQDLWRAVNVEVENSAARWTEGTAMATQQAGNDPFADLWPQVFALTASLTDLGAESVEVLDHQVAEAKRMQLLLGPLIAGATVGAIALGWFVSRRMQRRVIRPLVELRAAAVAMRASDIELYIQVPEASAEIRDLANSLNETSIALRSSHHRLHQEARTDALSGLPNRRAFVEALHCMLVRDREGPIGVLLVDLDDFKVINDTLGHAAGDELIQVLGRRLRAATRHDELVARIGGDEFAIAIPQVYDAGTLPSIAERTLVAIHEPVLLGDKTINMGCSIGAAGTTGVGAMDVAAAADEVIRNADAAMYLAKGHGKSRIEVFTPSIASSDVESDRRVQRASAPRSA